MNQYISYNDLDQKGYNWCKNSFFGELEMQFQIHLFYGKFNGTIFIKLKENLKKKFMCHYYIKKGG